MKIRTCITVLYLKQYLTRSFSSSKNVTSSFKPSYWHNPGTEPLSCLTFGQLIQQASEKYGEKEVVVSVYQNHRLTFTELLEQADKLAAGLLEIGLEKGDRVGLWSPNSIEWCIASCAVARAGLVLVNINPAFQSSELEYCLRKVGIKTLITASTFKSQNYRKLLLNVLPELSASAPGELNSEKLPTFKTHIIIGNEKLPGSFRYKDILEFGSTSSLQRVKNIQDEIQPDEGWNVQFTSGTTGSAKATLLSHHNTVNNSYGIGKRFELDRKQHLICLQVPLFHCFGNVIGLSASLHYGSTVVLPSPHFNAEESLKAIQKERCTILFGTPTMHVDMISTVRQSNIVPESLETVVTGGAPCSQHLCNELYDVLKVKQICSVFGMTELSPVSFQNLPTDSLEQITTTVGYLSDHLEAKVIDTNDNIVPMGTPGEICIRGYSTMLKYFNDEENTNKMIGNDRWLRTGLCRQFHTLRQLTGSIAEKHVTKYSNVQSESKKIKPSYYHCLSKEPLTSMNLGQLVEKSATKYGTREALVSLHQGHRLTFEQVQQRITNIAAGLLELGLKPGDRVAVWGPNSTEWYLTDLAVSKAGLILVNINPAYVLPELEYCINKVQVKMLIVAEKYRDICYYDDMLLNLIPELKSTEPGQLNSQKLPHLKSVVSFAEGSLPGTYSFSDIEKVATQSSYDYLEDVQSQIQPDTPCNIQFTSGTTGKPKAVIITHHMAVNNTFYQGVRLTSGQYHRICLLSPFFHALANILGIVSALHFGTTLVLPSAIFSGLESVEAIENEKCTGIIGTPTMYIDMLTKADRIKTASPDWAMCAGAPASKDLYENVMKQLKVKQMCSLYGMTEILGGTLSIPKETSEQMYSTVGCTMPHSEVKIVDSEGKMVPFGSPGELWVRGYNVTPGYWGYEEKTRDSFGPGKWFKTGDRLCLREDGYMEIVGRIKDMIIRGGENIYPKEIEDHLHTHPNVLEAQVVGVPHERLGEEVCAFVHLKDNCGTTEEELKEFCKKNLSYYKVPRYFQFIQEFPKTATGKVQKYRLKEIYEELQRN